jgi:predicted small metal-binding protein
MILVRIMGKFRYKCEDTGFKCGFHIEADSKEDIMHHLRIHAMHEHNIGEEDAKLEEMKNQIIEKV